MTRWVAECQVGGRMTRWLFNKIAMFGLSLVAKIAVFCDTT